VHNLETNDFEAVTIKGSGVNRSCHSAIHTMDGILILGGYNFDEEQMDYSDFLNQSASSDKFSTSKKPL
jgi:hypothetical protein